MILRKYFKINSIHATVTAIAIISCIHHSHAQVTFLEAFLPLYRLFRKANLNFIGKTDNDWSYEWNLVRGKVQTPFPESQPFFCDPMGPGRRSDTVPKSVHELRPGDIDVIAAMGDSLTAGNGALATNILQVSVENKGVSGTIGGQSTWRKFLTLPNILKEFNPNLYGYSLSDGFSVDRSSRFNIAEMGGMSRDIPNEALVLIKRMIADSHVNISGDWKLITILIGPNDFCSNFCDTDDLDRTVEHHENDLVIALRSLRDHLPRTMVNLITPPDLSILTELRGKPMECVSIHHVECPCLFGFRYRSKRKLYFKTIKRWQQVSVKVSNMDEFNKEDFIVINQPFLRDVVYPTLPNGDHDFTYMSLDCFHLSQKGYAMAINSLWNNMFQPEGQKWTTWRKEFTKFECPTYEEPYIKTRRNS